MTSPRDQIEVMSDRLVLVEGLDEVNLIGKMLQEWGIGWLQVIQVGGKDNFRRGLDAATDSALTTGIELAAISVLRDADDHPDRALQSVQDAVRNAGLIPPDSHANFCQASPAIGIFILPDGINPGAIEDLCWEAVRDTPAVECSTSYLECLQASGSLLSTNRSKTLVHTYLASRGDPSATVGIGALQDSWPLGHVAFNPLKEFLYQLATM